MHSSRGLKRVLNAISFSLVAIVHTHHHFLLLNCIILMGWGWGRSSQKLYHKNHRNFDQFYDFLYTTDLKARSLTGTGLLLHRHDLKHLILQRASGKECVNDLTLLKTGIMHITPKCNYFSCLSSYEIHDWLYVVWCKEIMVTSQALCPPLYIVQSTPLYT